MGIKKAKRTKKGLKKPKKLQKTMALLGGTTGPRSGIPTGGH